jgi:hypothetical protein
MFAEVGKKRAFLTIRGSLRQGVQPKVTPLEFPFAKISPLGESNRFVVWGTHLERVTVN